MSDFDRLLIVDNYSATAAAGMAQYTNTITVDAIPGVSAAGANGKTHIMPVTLISGATVISTLATNWSGNVLTLAYSAPAGGLAGPVTVMCAPNALVHALSTARINVEDDPYNTNHYPVLDAHNQLYCGSYVSNDHTIYLPTPPTDPATVIMGGHAPKMSMLLRFDHAAQTVAFVVPSGYTLMWQDAAPPTLVSGRTKLLVDLTYSKASNSFILGSFRRYA